MTLGLRGGVRLRLRATSARSARVRCLSPLGPPCCTYGPRVPTSCARYVPEVGGQPVRRRDGFLEEGRTRTVPQERTAGGCFRHQLYTHFSPRPAAAERAQRWWLLQPPARRRGAAPVVASATAPPPKKGTVLAKKFGAPVDKLAMKSGAPVRQRRMTRRSRKQQ